MLRAKDLFEIPVYRLSEELYYEKTHAHIVRVNANKKHPLDEAYLRKEYGGDWRYNEIIGFLRFYRYGDNQIRCRYQETDTIKKIRTRKKRFQIVSDSYCREPFSRSDENKNLAQTMRNAVEHCEVVLQKKSRYLDRELFDSTVDFMDWRSLLG